MYNLDRVECGWQDKEYWYWYWEGEVIEYTSSFKLWEFGIGGRISFSFKPFQIIIRLVGIFFMFDFIVEGN